MGGMLMGVEMGLSGGGGGGGVSRLMSDVQAWEIVLLHCVNVTLAIQLGLLVFILR